MHIQKLKNLLKGTTMVGLMLLVGLLVLVAAPLPAFAANTGTIGGLFPPPPKGNAKHGAGTITEDGTNQKFVFRISGETDLQVGDVVTFDIGPGRTATDVVSDNPI